MCGGAMVVLGLPIVLWLKAGYLDQYDFWVGTFGLVVFSLVEVILFGWMFGGGNMWGKSVATPTCRCRVSTTM